MRGEHLQAARGGTICTGGRSRAREKPSNEVCDKIESLMRGILGGVLWEYEVPSKQLDQKPTFTRENAMSKVQANTKSSQAFSFDENQLY